MTDRIVHQPERPHHCSPGWTKYVITDNQIPELNGKIGLAPPDPGIPDGTVIECECGRTWVAHHDNRNRGWLGTDFRPEGRIERWRRQRRSRAG